MPAPPEPPPTPNVGLPETRDKIGVDDAPVWLGVLAIVLAASPVLFLLLFLIGVL